MFFSTSTNKYVSRKQRGFTLLLAALVASIVLSMGASIYQLSSKQVALSSLGRDSQAAFFIADQAAECALYWDNRFGYFATSAPAALVAPSDPTCDAQHWTPAGGSGRPAVNSIAYPGTPTYTMMFQYQPTQGPGLPGLCAIVTVTKTLKDAQGTIDSVIHADGYSVSCATLSTNPRTLQRSVELRY